MAMTTARRVGVFEINAHENFLSAVVRIARAAGFEVTVFTSETVGDRVADSLDGAVSQWVVRSDDERLGAFLDRVSERCRDLDLLYSFPLNGSLPEFVRYARFDPPCPLVLSIFNANSWVARNLRLTPKLYNYGRIPLRRRILDRVDAVTVEYDPIGAYLDDHLGLPIHTMTPVVGGAQTDATARDGPLRVTVPGNVVASRRRYDVLFDALTALPSAARDGLALHLLGRPMDASSRRILDRADSLRAEGWAIEYHDGWIPSDEFDAALSRSDVICSPLCRKKAHGVAMEVYGRTKSSGALADAVRTATPLVLPETFRVPDQFGAGTATYADAAALGDLIETLVARGDRLATLRAGARSVADHYTLDAQADRFRTLVDAVADPG